MKSSAQSKDCQRAQQWVASHKSHMAGLTLMKPDAEQRDVTEAELAGMAKKVPIWPAWIPRPVMAAA